MIIVMRERASEEQIDAVLAKIREFNFQAAPSRGIERTIIGVIGEETRDKIPYFEVLDGVERVVPILKAYKLVAREARPEGTQVRVRDVVFGAKEVVIIAGPCAVESEEQILQTARWVKQWGAKALRGGAFKPRTSPYSFRGLEKEGLKLLAKAREETGLPVVTEVMDTRDVELVGEYADILQIGARNTQNFSLLDEVGRQQKPVLLKRGMACTVEDLLQSAEYIAKEGNQQIILCERGIRTFETETRNTLDVSAIPAVHNLSHLPIIADPSHATGHWGFVAPTALAAIAAGADGLIVEIHPNPASAASNGPQSLNFENFKKTMEQVRKVAEALGRGI